MTRKRRLTRSRQALASVKRKGLIGRHALARELQQTRRCPLCHSAPMQCHHVTLDVFSELQERLIADPAKHRPWPFQHAGRWPL